MKALIAIALLPLALAACGDLTPTQPGNGIRIANPESDRMKAAPAYARRIALMGAIHDAHGRCHNVVNEAYQEYYRGLEMWVAQCDDGKHWAIFIAANGDVQVRDCEQAPQLGLPLCRLVTPMPPDPLGPGSNAMGNMTGNAT
jgi:hypothetical protein